MKFNTVIVPDSHEQQLLMLEKRLQETRVANFWLGIACAEYLNNMSHYSETWRQDKVQLLKAIYPYALIY